LILLTYLLVTHSLAILPLLTLPKLTTGFAKHFQFHFNQFSFKNVICYLKSGVKREA